jgi:hypothetical protein
VPILNNNTISVPAKGENLQNTWHEHCIYLLKKATKFLLSTVNFQQSLTNANGGLT